MPLAVGTVIPPPPPVPPAPTPRPADIPAVTWISPRGKVVPLTIWDRRTTPGWFTPAPGPSGWDAAPRSLVTTPRERGGATVQHIQREPKEIIHPLYVEGPTHAEFVARWRYLMRSITETSEYGPGRYQVARPDGSVREIFAYYQDGFAGLPDAGIRWNACAPVLFCPDPCWRDLAPTPIVRQGSPGGRSFLKRFPRVSSSQTFGATLVHNPGDVEAWPIWRITGPATTVTATNNTRDEQWVLDMTGDTLGVNETVTVDTETGQVTGPDGSSWADRIDWTTAVLWRLDDADSSVEFEVTGAGAGSLIDGEFYARYESA